MKSYVIDIETIGQAPEVLEARMPEELRNPVMPESIANPPEVDLSGCPKYASCKSEVERNARQEAWCEDKTLKANKAHQEARQKWELGVMEARTKFTQNAALDARLGHAKLIGMKDAATGESVVFVWEADPAQMSRIRAWYRSGKFPEKLTIRPFMTEGEMLTDFFTVFACRMEGPAFGESYEKGQCVTYCGNSFDFPFLYRRSWLTGAPQVPLYRRGRYWDESRMVDLRDIWTFGSREDKDRSGGLDNMAAALGYERPKLHHGADFHRFYQEDPTEGIAYLLGDLTATEHCARKMGVVR